MVRATVAPAPASSPVPGLCRLAHFLCAGGPRLLIDTLAGKCAIKTSLRLELDLRRPAGVVQHSSSAHEENFFNLDGNEEMIERRTTSRRFSDVLPSVISLADHRVLCGEGELVSGVHTLVAGSCAGLPQTSGS